MRYVTSATALALWVTGAQAGCVTAPEPCIIESGAYHAELPAQQNPPVVMFLHGAGSTGGSTLRNRDLVEGFTDRGYAVLAPTASRPFGNGNGRSWNFYPGWEGRAEGQFLQDVLADADARFGLNTDQTLLSGFSAGGFMVSYLACATPEAFSAFAPVAGGFWRPHPEKCTGPVRLHQTHGWADRTVPLEGRFLGGGRFQQGDIFAGLEIWRATNDCADERPDQIDQVGIYLRRIWSDCAPGASITFALFAGGHTIAEGWPDLVLNWFEAQP